MDQHHKAQGMEEPKSSTEQDGDSASKSNDILENNHVRQDQHGDEAVSEKQSSENQRNAAGSSTKKRGLSQIQSNVPQQDGNDSVEEHREEPRGKRRKVETPSAEERNDTDSKSQCASERQINEVIKTNLRTGIGNDQTE